MKKIKNILNKNYSKRTIIFLFIAAIALLQSCKECPLEESKPVNTCHVLEASITQFNSGLAVDTAKTTSGSDTIYYIPVPTYYIQTFSFPDNYGSPSYFLDDTRFANSEKIPIISAPFTENGINYLAGLYDDTPLNSDMVGDLLVDSVFLAPSFIDNIAYIRVHGLLSRINTPVFLSESAQDFCNFINNNTFEINNAAQRVSEYGKEIGTGSAYSVFSEFASINPKGSIDSTVNVPTDIRSALAQQANQQAFTVAVKPGELYYYVARSGKSYVFVVTNIDNGNLPPNKKFMTIMFNPY
jgi:hypothetical protein